MHILVWQQNIKSQPVRMPFEHLLTYIEARALNYLDENGRNLIA